MSKSNSARNRKRTNKKSGLVNSYLAQTKKKKLTIQENNNNERTTAFGEEYDTATSRIIRNIEPPGNFLEQTTGFLVASIFSLCYYITPGWFVATGLTMIFRPFSYQSLALLCPLLISTIIPPLPMGWLLKTRIFQSIPKYFQYKEILEIPPAEMDVITKEKPALICLHPHGVFSMVALCSAVKWSQTWWDPRTTPTAVADSILHVPILKHIIGILGITSASAKPLIKTLNSDTNRGCILYPGGTSELFLCNPDRERLHLLDRKGFVRIALTQGCVLFPGYLFGNTTVLRLWQWSFLRNFSRKTGFALTYFYGRFFLPLPLPEPCVCVIGKPIQLPSKFFS